MKEEDKDIDMSMGKLLAHGRANERDDRTNPHSKTTI